MIEMPSGETTAHARGREGALLRIGTGRTGTPGCGLARFHLAIRHIPGVEVTLPSPNVLALAPVGFVRRSARRGLVRCPALPGPVGQDVLEWALGWRMAAEDPGV
jgi:hypothetical protein